MDNTSYFEKVNNLIDQLFYEGTINEGTLQCLSDIFDGLDSPNNKEEFISQLKETYEIDSNIESIKSYLDHEFKAWESEHEDAEEILKDRFNIGKSMQYSNVKDFLKDLDYEIMQGILNGSITSGFKQTIPEELFEFLPLESFEEQIEESITKFYDDPEEYMKKAFKKKEFPNFDEKAIDILVYIEETFGAEYICEIAFDQGYSIGQVKELFFETYQNKNSFQEQIDNEELLTKTRHKLSTELWPEGETAAAWWRKKAQEKNDDKNFLTFSENMVKFHLKEIRGSYILDCLKDLPLEEKARIIKEAKNNCEWFIK
tara:strand:+ start:9416 stop:10360 length:945 start_codon:yes stop_codon:yes gene_type:complete